MNEIIKLTPTPSSKLYVRALENILLKVKDIDGDILELGTYKGTNSVIFGKLIKKHGLDKKYIGIDTFTGYVPKQLEDSEKFVSKENRLALEENQNSGRWEWSIDNINTLLEDCDLDDISKIYEGDISIIVPTIKDKIALLYVDCNVFTIKFLSSATRLACAACKSCKD